MNQSKLYKKAYYEKESNHYITTGFAPDVQL